MKVLSKYMLVRKVLEKKQANSGLLLSGADTNDMRYHKAVVHMVGELVSGINADDIVLYDKLQSFDIVLDNERMTIIQEKDVVCVL